MGYAPAIVVAVQAPVASRVVAARQRIVTLGQLIDLTAVPLELRTRAAALPIASFRRSHAAMRLSSRRVVERAWALMPVLTLWLGQDRDETIDLSAADATGAEATTSDRGCMTAVRAIPAGAALAEGDFVESACDGPPPPAPFRYDAALSAVRALRDIEPGEATARVPAAALASVRVGQRLFVSSRVGPVRVERQVRAVQPDVSGRALFVMGADGDIFAAPAPGRAP